MNRENLVMATVIFIGFLVILALGNSLPKSLANASRMRQETALDTKATESYQESVLPSVNQAKKLTEPLEVVEAHRREAMVKDNFAKVLAITPWVVLVMVVSFVAMAFILYARNVAVTPYRNIRGRNPILLPGGYIYDPRTGHVLRVTNPEPPSLTQAAGVALTSSRLPKMERAVKASIEAALPDLRPPNFRQADLGYDVYHTLPIEDTGRYDKRHTLGVEK